MSGRDRCDEILELIDDALAEYDRAPRPGSTPDRNSTQGRRPTNGGSRGEHD